MRRMAIVALGEVGGDAAAAAEPLAALIAGADPIQRSLAGAALARIGPPAVKPLIALLKKDTQNVRMHALYVLRQLEGNASEAVPALMDLLGDRSPLLRRMSALTLGRIGPAADRAVDAPLPWATTPIARCGSVPPSPWCSSPHRPARPRTAQEGDDVLLPGSGVAGAARRPQPGATKTERAVSHNLRAGRLARFRHRHLARGPNRRQATGSGCHSGSDTHPQSLGRRSRPEHGCAGSPADSVWAKKVGTRTFWFV